MDLIITIDTEEDSGPKWINSIKPEFNGIYVGVNQILQPLFNQLGVKANYLLSPIILFDPKSVDILKDLKNVEFGTHLHSEQIFPNQERTLNGGSRLLSQMQIDLPYDVEAEKVKYLTELFKLNFDYSPKTFRCGRYGISSNTISILRQNDYLIDSSVTPGINWTSPMGNIVNFKNINNIPYFIGETGSLYSKGNSEFLEIPITIINEGGRDLWLRPGYSTFEEMKWVIDYVKVLNNNGCYCPLVFMFHNVEVLPNKSPYTISESDVNNYLKLLSNTLEYALKSGFESSTLMGAYNNLLLSSRGSLKSETVTGSTLNLNLIKFQNSLDSSRELKLSSFEEFNNSIDIKVLFNWVLSNLKKDSSIATYCTGAFYKLFEYCRFGFTNTTLVVSDKKTLDQYDLTSKYLQIFSKNSLTYNELDQIPVHAEYFDFVDLIHSGCNSVDEFSDLLLKWKKFLRPNFYLIIDLQLHEKNNIEDYLTAASKIGLQLIAKTDAFDIENKFVAIFRRLI